MSESIQKISVIVPTNPFLHADYSKFKHCLCALDVEDLMRWWPGTPHTPHRNPEKVKSIQRSLDWKRVAQIAAYLLQEEIIDAPGKIDYYFKDIYEPKKNEPGREWPPKISRVIGFERSEYRVFSNVLIHVNGAKLEPKQINGENGAADLTFDEQSEKLYFSVIDGQHRINGAYFAIKLLQAKDPKAKWQLPAEVFLDLDPLGQPPRLQAQIFIDVNFYQKKVDRSLVADLFPTARGKRTSLDNKERAQDIGRKLMLEKGPLVGMIQIPGIKFGYKDVITLATLNSSIESTLDVLNSNGIVSLENQTEFLAQCLDAWLNASGRFETKGNSLKKEIGSENVAYQGRVLVSILSLVPAMIWKLKEKGTPGVSEKSQKLLVQFLTDIANNAGLLADNIFISKEKFKAKGFLGSGGIARFRDTLWAAINKKITLKTKPETISKYAEENKSSIIKSISYK